MATFTAYNVEPDSDTESEIDDTKEIHVEEALKLYQNALKLHSQGPGSFDAAEQAYSALFDSEIFTYPEALPEAKRLDFEDDVESDAEDVEVEGVVPPIVSTESAPSALPQVLYLSFKNYGQFLLDRLAYEHAQLVRSDSIESQLAERSAATKSLQQFAEALGRDSTDLDLWMRVARLGQLLGIPRLARFCLEAIIESSVEEEISLSGDARVEERFAREKLDEMLSRFASPSLDGGNIQEAPRAKPLSQSIKAALEPCAHMKELPAPPALDTDEPCKTLTVKRSWESLGNAILAELQSDEERTRKFGTLVTVMFEGAEEVPSTILRSGPPLVPDSLAKRRNTMELVLSPKTPVPSSSMQPTSGGDPTQSSLRPGTATSVDKQTSARPDKTDSTRPDTARPGTAGLDSAVAEGSPIKTSNNNGEAAAGEKRPSLKRNSDAAGLQEAAEGVRVRSKRLRAKAEVAEDDEPKDLTRYYEEQLQPCDDADEALFSTLHDLLSKAGLHGLKDAARLRSLIFSNADSALAEAQTPELAPLFDFKEALCRWDLNRSNLLLHGNGSGASVTLIGSGDDSGLSAFLEHSKPATKPDEEPDTLTDQGLKSLVATVNRSLYNIEDFGLAWLKALLSPVPNDTDASTRRSSYMQYVWSPSFKDAVIRLLVRQDDYLVNFAEHRLLTAQDVTSEHSSVSNGVIHEIKEDVELIQTIFELHLDLYSEYTQPNSKADQPSRLMQRDRMRRWARISNSAFVTKPAEDLTSAVKRETALRHLWSSVIYVSIIEASSRDHVLLCLRDLESTLRASEAMPVFLPNNPTMPVISAQAAEAEISRLTTMDFFMGIFDTDRDKPVAVIEALEPILLPSLEGDSSPSAVEHKPQDTVAADTSVQETAEAVGPSPADETDEDHPNRMSDFLRKTTVSLRLSLWHRLKSAYEAIEYPPMVLVCNMHSMSAILADIQSAAYTSDTMEARSGNLIVWIRNIVDLVSESVDLVLNHDNALLCLDEAQLRIAFSALLEVIKIFHVFALYEDSLRVGQTQAPAQASGATVPSRSSMNMLRDMQPKVWILLYTLVREQLQQNASLVQSPQEELISILTVLHRGFGAREYCKLGKKMLVRFAKTQLLNINAIRDAEDELAQVLYDLYGLKLCPTTPLEEHGCSADALDRPTALDIIEFVMIQANRLNVKDLVKSDIKVATEKMQAVIGQPRGAGVQQGFNRRVVLAYLKSSINPMNLYKALKGIGGITGMPVTTDFAAVVHKRWFFLLGQILLARHRSQKRTSRDTSGDLDEAIKFFKIDLDFDTENWETWYRLGQATDSKIEEQTTWNAEDINNPASDLVALQRQTIHCYAMALAVAIRNADDSFETAAKITDLHIDFGNRVYASSRPPFSMLAFSVMDNERFCNSVENGTYKREPFRPLKEPAVFLFAAELFRTALVDRPEDWMSWFMLGKCLWKLFRCATDASVDHQPPLDAFMKAVECAPERRDSRHPERDPILEPHYKLVSVVHKLVHGRRLSPEEGAQILHTSPHTRKVELDQSDNWKEYILSVLRTLRAADKSNWHHRMVARAAHIHYDDSSKNVEAAQAAKHELTQQIFTKTMAVQVWKPENERAGRHFVYTTRYVRFFVELLFRVGDRAALEGLGRKIRRKQGDFVEHATMWHEYCLAYLHLLRFQGGVPEGHEDAVFKTLLPFDVFAQNAARLEQWAHSPAAIGHATLDLLRELLELKRLNAGLMRPTLFDDLIGDAYARLYERVSPRLAAEAETVENRERMRIDRMLMVDEPAPAAPDATRATTPSDPNTTGTGRMKSIGRTEVRRRAEALVARPAAGPPARGRPPAAAGAGTRDSAGRAAAGDAATADKDGAVGSAPPSVHDSDDDESELTDIDEVEDEEPQQEEEAAPMFPGLRKGSGHSASAAVDDEDGSGEDAEGKDEGGEEREEDEVPDSQEAEAAPSLDVEMTET